MVITTIKSTGVLARELRQILGEYYDLEIKTHHTPDGSDLLVELVLYPKGSLPVEKHKKKNRI